ncbi:protocadherin gamma-B4-like [Sinocyclocheilus grahami]|uniref:protocadherin gamma-B4-like n=1 Tax=Sinocyclocheilus grahami TaxID=75366 RepID=UPI0007AD05E6|nr:PREDICTED: protocadherin gamma-B4-like [Sinocyclocheilus grahami]
MKRNAGFVIELSLCFYVMMAHTAYGDVSYSFPEEMKRGSVIGNIAKDLGLDVNRLSSRKARIDTEGNRKRYCDINLNTGELTVAERIDREGLCGKKASCVLKQELMLENPLELHRISLHIDDINDNSPHFDEDVIRMEIRESADKGERFLLGEAHDPDIGNNAVLSYTLKSNENFVLYFKSNDLAGKYCELVLNKELDREQQKEVALILTAVDGGTPPRSDTVVVTVSATDADEGQNGKVSYAFGHVSEEDKTSFLLNRNTGDITVIGSTDYEEKSVYELRVLAKDSAEVEGAGTLRSTYNYDAYLTTGSRTSDFKFVRSYNEGTLTADLTLNTTQSVENILDDLGNKVETSQLN